MPRIALVWRLVLVLVLVLYVREARSCGGGSELGLNGCMTLLGDPNSIETPRRRSVLC